MKNYSLFLDACSQLISFNTENAPAVSGAPFGLENKKALDFFLTLAKSFGFETINYDNYAGEIIFGNGKTSADQVGIIGHLDIIPVGTGWNTPPLKLTEKDGKFYGRGVSDDKLPCLLILFAMKELKDAGIIPERTLRFFVGCNEESGWQDVEYLKTKTTLPEYGFSPDGIFPLSYAEKGMYEIAFLLPPLKNFSNIKGGTAINAVCANASCTAVDGAIIPSLLEKHNLKANGNTITATGVSAHGSAPHLGVNAFKSLFSYMADAGENLKDAIDYLFNDKAGIFNLKNEQGIVTFSPNMVKTVGKKTYLLADMRIPAPFDQNTVIPALNQFGLEYTITEKQPPVVVEKDGWMISKLLSAYKENTGEQTAEPVSMGGSTFARAFKKGCSFGPEFKGVSYHIHDANEQVDVAEVEKTYNIYLSALNKLAKI